MQISIIKIENYLITRSCNYILCNYLLNKKISLICYLEITSSIPVFQNKNGRFHRRYRHSLEHHTVANFWDIKNFLIYSPRNQFHALSSDKLLPQRCNSLSIVSLGNEGKLMKMKAIEKLQSINKNRLFTELEINRKRKENRWATWKIGGNMQ